eukprot:3305783-Lingulodinium_polyedra.AAC.1
MHVNVRAAKQNPFRAWARGAQACTIDLYFPGQRAAARQAEALGRLPCEAGDGTVRAASARVRA